MQCSDSSHSCWKVYPGRGSIYFLFHCKNAAHSHPYRVISVRPTLLEDWKIPSQQDPSDANSFQPMHGLKLVVKEDVVPQEQMPHFPAVEKLAAKGLLAVETWNNKRAMINFKATIEVPMLGTMIESCGDTLDESHMPLGWPMSIDGAVRQFCMHKRDTIQELDNMLAEFNLQRSSVEINRNTTLWSHNSVRSVERAGPLQEIIPLPGIYFFDGWRVHPSLIIQANLPQIQDVPFFRPTPLWLSPGRHTMYVLMNAQIQDVPVKGTPSLFFSVLRLCGSRQVVTQCCADERISQVHEAASLLGKSKKKCGPLRSPKSCQADKRKTAQTKQTQKQTKHPEKSAPIKSQLRWGRQLMCQ